MGHFKFIFLSLGAVVCFATPAIANECENIFKSSKTKLWETVTPRSLVAITTGTSYSNFSTEAGVFYGLKNEGSYALIGGTHFSTGSIREVREVGTSQFIEATVRTRAAGMSIDRIVTGLYRGRDSEGNVRIGDQVVPYLQIIDFNGPGVRRVRFEE